MCSSTVTVLGALYEKLGRLVGRSFEETLEALLKVYRGADASLRAEVRIQYTLSPLSLLVSLY